MRTISHRDLYLSERNRNFTIILLPCIYCINFSTKTIAIVVKISIVIKQRNAPFWQQRQFGDFEGDRDFSITAVFTGSSDGSNGDTGRSATSDRSEKILGLGGAEETSSEEV